MKTNISQYFMLNKQILSTRKHKFRKIFNRNTLKLSCPNLKGLINNHNQNPETNLKVHFTKEDSLMDSVLNNICCTTLQSPAKKNIIQSYLKEFSKKTFKKRYVNFKKSFEYWALNPLSANPTKWSNTLKWFGGCWRRIVSVCLTISRGWCLKG